MKLFNTYISKKFRKLMVAGVVSNAIMCIVSALDIILAGVLLGEQAVEAVNIVYPIILMGTFVFLVPSIGVPIIYSQRMGSFDKKEADTVFSTGLILTIAVSACIILLGLAFREIYLNTYGIDEELLELSREYFTWMVFAVALRGPSYYIYAMVLVDGDSMLSMLCTVVLLVGRIIFAALSTPSMGISGLSAAFIASNIMALLVCLPHLFKKGNSLHFIFRFDAKLIPVIAKYSIVDAGVYAFSSIFTLFLNKLTEHNFGVSGLLIASAICFVKEVYYGLDGIGLAMEPYINIYRGQKSRDGIRNTDTLALFWSVAVGLIMNALLVLSAPIITRYLGITDPIYVDIVTKGVIIMGCASVFNGLVFCITSHFLYIGRIFLGFMGVALNNFLIMIVCVSICTPIFGLLGPFIGVAITPVASAIVLSIYILIRYGVKEYPLLLEYYKGVKDDKIFQYSLDEKKIISLRDAVGEYLNKYRCSDMCVNEALLLLEDMNLFIKEENEKLTGYNKLIKGECAVIIEKDITMIICVDGILLDMSKIGERITSFRGYVVSNHVKRSFKHVQNLITLGTNRCQFVIPGEYDLPDNTN